MTVLITIIAFLAGVAIGGAIVYFIEKNNFDKLIDRCNEISEQLADMIKQEEDFMKSMWPKTYSNPHKVIPYFSEDNDWSDCEDESDNMYI